MKLVFSSLKNGTIFENDFQHLTDENGTIEFKQMRTRGGIAVLYAPNGTGKTSFVTALEASSSSKNLSFTATDEEDTVIRPESEAFHVIGDQISRNMIPGEETDYLIGAQIKREYELREKIDDTILTAYKTLKTKFKSDYGVRRVNDYLLVQIGTLAQGLYPDAFWFIRNIVNVRGKASDLDIEKFLTFIRNNTIELMELDESKREFIISDSANAQIVDLIRSIDDSEFVGTQETILVQRHNDAIGLLKKYPHMHTCIVCDNENIDTDTLLSRKQEQRQQIYETLSDTIKGLLEKVINAPSLLINDPFEIRRIVSDFIAGAEPTEFINLKSELERYVHSIGDEMVNELFSCFDGTTLFSDYDEYKALISTQPQLDDEELMFIQNVISENVEKDIRIIRNEGNDRNFKLMLGEIPLIGTSREELHLSTGEQNFISLSFELLLARHSDKEYVVLDDPISSFDSVYKNKIAFCIIKFLEEKKQIVLTHNLDLVRLLEVQWKDCFNLYLLNNSESGTNGFIPVNEKEKRILINIYEFIELLRSQELFDKVHNPRLFLMALIPFMRGYAHICYDPEDYYSQLSSVMHGYSTVSVDVGSIYQQLFGGDISGPEIFGVEDVLGLDFGNLSFMDNEEYPLLAETLEQSLIYYYLRLKVEKVLVDVFNIEIRRDDPVTLYEIIRKALACDQADSDYEIKRELRVFFTSRKTLLNEFNHFEGNMNIFQPAIDIERSALYKERNAIEEKLLEIQERYGNNE